MGDEGREARQLADDVDARRKAEEDLSASRSECQLLEWDLGVHVEELKAIDEELRASLAEVARGETERHSLHDDLDRLERCVSRHIVRMQDAYRELDSFSHSVAHDLHAPLRAIYGYSGILADRMKSTDPESVRLCGLIHENAQRMRQLIDALLAYALQGVRPIEPARVNMAELAAQVIDELRTLHSERRIDFAVRPLPDASGDPVALRQVFLNLLSNAVKFTAGNPVAHICVSGQREGDECVYWVQDDGVGFDMAYADKLFLLFQRLHSRFDFEGNGVGLAIVQRIVRRHGGRVWAKSEPGRGATFWFSVPRNVARISSEPL